MQPFSSVQVETVTPELAAAWLSRIPEHQRKLGQSNVNRWARIMRDGSWQVSPQTVSLDTNGAPVDGQHRLAAVVQTGLAQQFLVVRGVDPALFDVLDVGYARSADQFLKGPYARDRSLVAKLLIWYDQPDPLPQPQGREMAIEMHDVLRRLEQDGPAIEAAVTEAADIRRSTAIPTATMGAVLAIARRSVHWDQERVQEWADGVRTGIGLTEGDPRAALRRYYFDNLLAIQGETSKSAGRIPPPRSWQAIVASFNAWMERRSIAHLKPYPPVTGMSRVGETENQAITRAAAARRAAKAKAKAKAKAAA